MRNVKRISFGTFSERTKASTTVCFNAFTMSLVSLQSRGASNGHREAPRYLRTRLDIDPLSFLQHSVSTCRFDIASQEMPVTLEALLMAFTMSFLGAIMDLVLSHTLSE